MGKKATKRIKMDHDCRRDLFVISDTEKMAAPITDEDD